MKATISYRPPLLPTHFHRRRHSHVRPPMRVVPAARQPSGSMCTSIAAGHT